MRVGNGRSGSLAGGGSVTVAQQQQQQKLAISVVFLSINTLPLSPLTNTKYFGNSTKDTVLNPYNLHDYNVAFFACKNQMIRVGISSLSTLLSSLPSLPFPYLA
jgi:hypothetical protein